MTNRPAFIGLVLFCAFCAQGTQLLHAQPATPPVQLGFLRIVAPPKVYLDRSWMRSNCWNERKRKKRAPPFLLQTRLPWSRRNRNGPKEPAQHVGHQRGRLDRHEVPAVQFLNARIVKFFRHLVYHCWSSEVIMLSSNKQHRTLHLANCFTEVERRCHTERRGETLNVVAKPTRAKLLEANHVAPKALRDILRLAAHRPRRACPIRPIDRSWQAAALAIRP